MKIKPILYTPKELSNGEHPIMIRISDGNARKYRATGYSTTPRFWDRKDNCLRNSHPDKSLIEKVIDSMIKELKDHKLDLESEQKDFTADMLIEGTKKPKRNKVSVFTYFTDIIERLVSSKQAGNAKVYTDAKNALEDFTHQKDVSFSAIDIQFLNKFEAHLRKRGCADNGISVRFRTLRALFNKAIEEGIVKASWYPFDKYKISKRFNTATQRRAITKEEVKKIEALVVDKASTLFEARQYFIFSYYGAGINFRDIAYLKWSNINNDRVVYTRSKTGKVLNFKLSAPALKIIKHWNAISGGHPDNYVFPIFDKEKHITDMQKHNRANKVLGIVNSDLKELGGLAKIKTPLTTYVARHSFATVLKKSGTGTAIISEAMGHKTEAITQIYLKNFENEMVDNAMKDLL